MAPRSRPPPVHHPTCRHLNQQWRHRLQHLHHQPRLDYFANSKNTLENTLYLHHADHELQQLISQQYFHGALAAWQSPEILKFPVHASSHARQRPRRLPPCPPPCAHVTSGACTRPSRPLRRCPPQTKAGAQGPRHHLLLPLPRRNQPRPGQLSTPQLWRHCHQYFTSILPTSPFTPPTTTWWVSLDSVPQHRLIDAVHSLVTAGQEQRRAAAITLDLKATSNPLQHSPYRTPH